jgi:hypothetical protein
MSIRLVHHTLSQLCLVVFSTSIYAQTTGSTTPWDEEFHQLSSQLAEDPYNGGTRAVVQLLGQVCELNEGVGHTRFYAVDANAAYRSGDLASAQERWRHIVEEPESSGWAAYSALWLLETSSSAEDLALADDVWAGVILEDGASCDADVAVELAKRLATRKQAANDLIGADALLAQSLGLTMGGRGLTDTQRRELLLARATLLRSSPGIAGGVDTYEALVALDANASGSPSSFAATALELAQRRAAAQNREATVDELWNIANHPKLSGDPNAAYVACELSFIAKGSNQTAELNRLADWVLANYAAWQNKWADPLIDHESSREDVRTLVHNLLVRGEKRLSAEKLQQLQNIKAIIGDPAGI